MSNVTRFNRVLATKFKGCKQIGFKDDPNVEGRRLLVYELPSDLLSDAEKAIKLVGINDGSSCWIGSLMSSLHNLVYLDAKDIYLTPTPRVRIRVALPAKPTTRTRIHVQR